MEEPEVPLRSHGSGGCLRALVAVPLLVVVAPPAAVVRWWQRRRRGRQARVEWDERLAPPGPGGAPVSVDVMVDVPEDLERRARTRVTELVVRLAEALRRPDDVYHLVVRLPWEDEPRLEPVGPRLQLLGERFELALGHAPFAGRTTVWLALGRSRSLAEAVDPLDADPEAEGEPDLLIARAGARWAAAVAVAHRQAAMVYRLVLVVPPGSRARLETLLAGLRTQLE